MRLLLITLSIAVILLSCSSSEDNEYYSYDYLTNDYNQVAVVALVDVQEVKEIDSIGNNTAGGYVRYLISARIVEAFKGDLKSTQTLEYYSVAEKDYNPENYKGDKIVFLEKVFDKRKHEWAFSELENSARPASKAIIKKMRTIKEHAKGR